MRDIYKDRRLKPVRPIAAARAAAPTLSYEAHDHPAPPFLGRKVLREVSLASIAEYIDWTFFFTSWQLKGRFPQILEDERYGEAARELYEHGQALLHRIIEERMLEARAVYGFWPAQARGEDIEVLDPTTGASLLSFNMLRQQQQQRDEVHRCLADFIPPADAGVPGYVGAFAVTTGIGTRRQVRAFEEAHDDYGAIMFKALADRLAEAFAEQLHHTVRTGWYFRRSPLQPTPSGFVASPRLWVPRLSRHTERELFELLGAPEVGITLTSHFAMSPAASVSGLYLPHPDARYFTLGRIDRDQVRDYARRKGMGIREVERWLAPNLAYEPDER